MHDRYPINDATTFALTGSVVETEGATVAVAGLPVPVGAVVEIDRDGGPAIQGEVIGFRDERTIVFPLQNLVGVRRGCRVRMIRSTRMLRVGNGLLGRVVNAHARCIDGRPHPMLTARVRSDREAPTPIERPPIDAPLTTGVRAIDGMLACGRGQRLGVFAGSGVGKSVLLGMMARETQADVTVIGLVGERGREVNEFIDRDLGPTGLARSVVVVATSDEPALMRMQAASTATAIAEHFRDQGKNVLLLVDSLTRVALANREIGLAAGEPPATRGYPPSTFALLPRLVERAGRTAAGSITAYYSVLVEGDDPNEPIADTVRGLLDGHVWLSRSLASEGHYPAIDTLESLSRLMPQVASQEHKQAAINVRRLLAAYREQRDLIQIGAYRKGSSKEVDAAIELRDEINKFLQQGMSEPAGDAAAMLIELGKRCEARLAVPAAKPQASAPVGPGVQGTPIAPVPSVAPAIGGAPNAIV